MGISIPYSYLPLSIHTYLCPNSQISGALYTGIEFYVSCQEFFCMYHFSLHDERGTYRFLHKQNKEKTCEYLYLIPIYLLAYIFMSYIQKQWRAVHGHRILCLMSGIFFIYIIFPYTLSTTHKGFYVLCPMSYVRNNFFIYHFSLHNEHNTYGLIHKQYKEKTCKYLYLIPIYI